MKFFATVREVAGIKNIEMDVDNIGELLESLKTKLGNRFTDLIINPETNKLKQFYSCIVNGKRIELLDGYNTILKDNDTIAVFPPVGGG